MKLVRTASRERGNDHLIPLINVIFLMLIFFMIAGRLEPSEPVAIEPPISAQGHNADDQTPVLFIGVHGRIAFDGEIVSRETLAERLAAWVKDTRGPTADTGVRLTLKADASLRAGEVRGILDLLRASGVAKVSLIAAQGRR